MSRIGRKPLPLPKGVDARRQKAGVGQRQGPQGQADASAVPTGITHQDRGRQDHRCSRADDDAPEPRQARPHARAPRQHGQGRHRRAATRELEINGVGYRAEVEGDTIDHGARLLAPGGVQAARRASPPRSTRTASIARRAPTSDLLGQTAAKIRELRPPEPYKGKGVKYAEESRSRRRSARPAPPAAAEVSSRRRMDNMHVDIRFKKARPQEAAPLAAQAHRRAPPSGRA